MKPSRILAEWYIVAASASHGVSAAPLQRCGNHRLASDTSAASRACVGSEGVLSTQIPAARPPIL